MIFEWESISFFRGRNATALTGRAKVFGGWIVRNNTVDSISDKFISESMVFVPDPKHAWEITE